MQYYFNNRTVTNTALIPISLFLSLLIASICSSSNSKAIADDKMNDGRIEMTLSSQEIYEGESTILQVSVVNLKLDEDPNIDDLRQNFEVESLGSSTFSNVSVTYDNSETKRIETKSIIYKFKLSPKRSGVIKIDAPKMLVDGRVVNANSIELLVKQASNTDIVLLETSVSPNNVVYPLVPFEVTVDVLLKEAPKKYSQNDLLESIISELGVPHLTIPWLQSRSISENTIGDVELEDWLNEINNNRKGFALNNFQISRSPFDFAFSVFDERRPAMFLPQPERVERIDAAGNKNNYIKYSFKRKMRAQVPTTITFSAPTLKGNFIRFDAQNEPTVERVYLVGKPLTVTVQSISDKEAPANYNGIFGSIKQSVTISSTDVAKGDAFTITISFTGYGSYEGVKAPNLASLLEQDDFFKTYPASERSLEDGVAFDYKVRPLQEGAHTIPAIRTSYFNVEKGDFVELSSEPIQINVRESLLPQNKDDSFVYSDDATNRVSKNDAIQTQLLKNNRIVLIIVLSCATIVALFLCGWGIILLSKAYNHHIAVSNKRIVENAQEQLNRGLEQLKTVPVEGIQTIRIAFIQLIGKRFNQAADALTDAEIVAFFDAELNTSHTKRLFQSSDTNINVAEILLQLRRFFQHAEQIRFGGGSIVTENYIQEIPQLFQQWTQLLLACTKKLSTLAISNKTE